MNNYRVFSLFDILDKGTYKGFNYKKYNDTIINTRNNTGDSDIEVKNEKEHNNMYLDVEIKNHSVDYIDSNWIEANTEIGIQGEEIVRCILEKEHGVENVKKQADYVGYDFFITGNFLKRIEVKTTFNFKNPIFITINELKKAMQHKLEYYIYLVIIDNKGGAKIYIIKNPIEKLGINMDYITNIINLDRCSIQIEKIKIEMKDTLKEEVEVLEFKYR